ncbi:hypothetical protein [Terrabacter terrigena]|uniref:Uncharacterized protein n=1 Tax=Terrabacter terrigena TaxID=574718 RepID=A0ABW3MRY1_9MICO
MDTIEIPCPTPGCGGVVQVQAQPIVNGTEWEILEVDGAPQVSCSRGCKPPAELRQPVKDELQAG